MAPGDDRQDAGDGGDAGDDHQDAGDGEDADDEDTILQPSSFQRDFVKLGILDTNGLMFHPGALIFIASSIDCCDANK